MLKIALEIPTAKLADWSQLTEVDFILAHKVLQDQEYANFFAARDSKELILDNSTHEYGHPLPMADLKRAAILCNADIVIAPDIVQPEMSMKQYFKNIEWMEETAKAMKQYEIAGVLCGQSDSDRDFYIRRAEGVADVLCFTFHDPRRLEWWRDFADHPLFDKWDRIHILGVSSLEELREWVKISWQHPQILFSVDTCKPLRMGFEGRKLEGTKGSLRSGGVGLVSKDVLDMKEFTTAQEDLIVENIMYLKKVCRGDA